jgi:hypothetical protein
MMASGSHTSFAAASRAMRRVVMAASLGLLAVCGGGQVSAQAPGGIYAPGNAAVTGFSGVLRPFQIEPGQDPDARTFIDPDGPSLRIVDLKRMDGPPAAQLVGVLKPFTVSAKWIGQVFGVALDDASPANVYVAATSAYGLSIVAPGPGGRPQHIQVGTAGAAFMPAQWGPGGSPGSIWKIDGVRGDVTLFANVAIGARANSGAALGGLAYDPATKSVFVADRETGLVHRFGLNGAGLGTYDHGVVGRAGVGLEPVAAESGSGIDVSSPQFDSGRPETWGYAAPERRVFGLAVQAGRLYYAVAEGLRVWSVGLNSDGSFAMDVRIEVAVPPSAGTTEISTIVFDDEGRMHLAERPAPIGAQDYEALSEPAIGRLLRYAPIGVTEAGQPIWQPAPDEYAVGFPAPFRNDNGGVAIGYGYDARGHLDPRSCGGFVWTTGEQLRNAADPSVAALLGPADALAIDGLQGMPAWSVRRAGDPPWMSYFVDYADAPPDASARGHMGDIAIRRACRGTIAMPLPRAPRGPRAGITPPPGRLACQILVCVPGKPACPPNQVWNPATDACVTGCVPPAILVNGQCCSQKDLRPGGACSQGGPGTGIAKPMCGVTQTAIGPNNACCDNDHIYSGLNGNPLCCASALQNGRCGQLIPKIPKLPCATCCAPGYVTIKGKCCLKSQATSTGQCCPVGQVPSPDGTHCRQLFKMPKMPLCCAAGFVPGQNGKCCAPANLTSSGECCAAPVNPKDRGKCATTSAPPQSCGPGEVRDPGGACVKSGRPGGFAPLVPLVPRTCGPNERRNKRGDCIPRGRPEPREPTTRRPPGGPVVCPPGLVPGPLGMRCRPGPQRMAPPALRGRAVVVRPPGRAPGPAGRR